MRQFGFSLMFLTAAPFKWTFPWSQWLSELRNQTGRGPAEVAIPETLHMAQSCETKRVADPQRLPYPRHCTWHRAAKPNGSRTRRGCHTRDTAHGTCPPTDHPQIFMRQKYQSLEKPRLRQHSDRSVNNVRNYFYRYEFQKGEHCSHSGLFGGSVRTKSRSILRFNPLGKS